MKKQEARNKEQKKANNQDTIIKCCFVCRVFFLLCFVSCLLSFPVMAEPFAVKVNNMAIPYSRYDSAIKIAGKNFPLPSPESNSVVSEGAGYLKKEILIQMINSLVVLQFASYEGVFIDEEEIADKINEMRGRFPSLHEYRESLKEEGLDEDLVYQLAKQELLQRRLVEEISKRYWVSDEEIDKFYKANSDIFQKPISLIATHLFVSSLEALNFVLERVKEKSTFYDAVKKLGFPSPEAYAIREEIKRKKYPPWMEDIIFSLEEGEISTPLEGVSGYHVFKIERKKLEPLVPIKTVKNKIRDFIQEEKGRTALIKWIEERKEISDIKVNPKLENLFLGEE